MTTKDNVRAAINAVLSSSDEHSWVLLGEDYERLLDFAAEGLADRLDVAVNAALLAAAVDAGFDYEQAKAQFIAVGLLSEPEPEPEPEPVVEDPTLLTPEQVEAIKVSLSQLFAGVDDISRKYFGVPASEL